MEDPDDSGVGTPASSGYSAPNAPARRPRPRPHGHTWVPAGHPAEIDGRHIPGGLIYVGNDLYSQSGAVEPSLVDPSLPVDRNRPDRDDLDLDTWPSYSTMVPTARSAYLTWLADGRAHPRAPLGFVLLFLYGLERRVIVDHVDRGAPAAELPEIAGELRRLLRVYGDHEAFAEPARDLLDLVSMLTGSDADQPGVEPGTSRLPSPVALRIRLGSLAAVGTPLPADVAVAWQAQHPTIRPPTAQARCPVEFAELFALRYRDRHGDGLVVDPDHPLLRIHYVPASSGLLPFDLDVPGVPDVAEEPYATRALASLTASVAAEIDAYSNFVARNPEGRHDVAARALLPAAITHDEHGPAAELLSWARRSLGSDASVVVDAAMLARLWPGQAPLSSADVVACAQLLERHGIGLEPDPRLGGPVINDGPAVLFEARGDMPRAAGPEYAAASTLLQLAVAVGGVDGDLQAVEQDVMLDHLASGLDLTPAEQERLAAHLHWLSAAGTRIADLGREVAQLSESRRSAIADVLVAVAAADGIVTADEIDILRRIFELLALPVSSLHDRLRAASVEIAAPLDPPTADEEPPAETAEAPPPQAAPALPLPAQPADAPRTVAVDPALLAATAASTAAVNSLLSDIFAEDEPPADIADAEETSGDGDDTAADGLDAAHRALLAEVLTRDRWDRAEFAALADRCGLMPAGALDTLNEHTIDVCDDVLLEPEGDDVLALNDFAVEAVRR